jgi:hypothetical protein
MRERITLCGNKVMNKFVHSQHRHITFFRTRFCRHVNCLMEKINNDKKKLLKWHQKLAGF